MLQTSGSIGVYAILWAFMIVAVIQDAPYWVVLCGIIPAAFVLVRIFILFHDCCHGSFFPSSLANRIVGHITGILTFTPFEAWRRSHLMHHATNAQLDHRGIGDVWTMTAREYRDSPLRVRAKYRLFRNPFIMFLLGPILIFLWKNRFSGKDASRKERISTLFTNLAILGIVAGGSVTIGIVPFILIQLPVIFIAGVIGVWLFYVQHQFDPGYWARDGNWSEVDAALEGSSFYDMPVFFQWLFGNIGIHHIHHLHPRIPNYRLRNCYFENPGVQLTSPLTVKRSLKSIRMNLWDESRKRYISFLEYNRLYG